MFASYAHQKIEIKSSFSRKEVDRLSAGDLAEVAATETGAAGRLGTGADRTSAGLDRHGSLNSRGLSSRGLDRGDDGGRAGDNVDSGGGGNRSRGVGGSAGDSGGRGNDGGGALSNGSEAGGESGTGDGVAVEGAVDVEADTSVGGSVEGSTLDTLGKDSAGTSDLNVEALRVVLGAVEVAAGVKGDDLVAKDVLAGTDVGGNLDHPAVVVVNEDIGSPPARGLGTVDKTSLGDLEELESSLLNLVAASVTARGKVVNDGAVVRLGPGVPLNKDAVTRGNNDAALSVGRVLVADDVARGERLGANEAIVGVGSGPGGNLGGVLSVREAVDVVALEGGTIHDNVLDVAVGVDSSGTGQSGEESLGGEGRHLEGLISNRKDGGAKSVEQVRLAGICGL